jgi:hypothetical protein
MLLGCLYQDFEEDVGTDLFYSVSGINLKKNKL